MANDNHTFVYGLIDQLDIHQYDDDFLLKVGSVALGELLSITEQPESVRSSLALKALACTQVLFFLSEFSPSVKNTLKNIGLGEHEIRLTDRRVQDDPNYSGVLVSLLNELREQGGKEQALAEELARGHIKAGERSEAFIEALMNLIGSNIIRKKRPTKVEVYGIIIEVHLLKKEGHKQGDAIGELVDEYGVSGRTIEEYIRKEKNAFGLFKTIDEIIDPIFAYFRTDNKEPSTLFWALFGVFGFEVFVSDLQEPADAALAPVAMELDVNPIVSYAALRFIISMKNFPIPARAECSNDCRHECKRYKDLDARMGCPLFQSEV